MSRREFLAGVAAVCAAIGLHGFDAEGSNLQISGTSTPRASAPEKLEGVIYLPSDDNLNNLHAERVTISRGTGGPVLKFDINPIQPFRWMPAPGNEILVGDPLEVKVSPALSVGLQYNNRVDFWSGDQLRLSVPYSRPLT